ncbi:NADPH:quinone reductase-like Zn-dependent oxidoreductase [Mucilaginibacter frigoritolerans]|uniref:NADPH:quinone reductase-like Zn-dependent oxidoreductase n=1 Tax=Mucilaginibacter frigoritolerans TaxID=652788 RepID=A0A562TWA7_9SPHI|nr:NADP-dependent oxidoreductase [Mucilaginibacter frigoritolerans]TWI97578.1 NADPH:quinone reductase-like Zn-dependent oxidoreductase [Mucilaginibacter frigoritolerans]
MKAIILKKFGPVENFELAEVATPVAASGQVLVRIKAAAFNPIDYQMRQGANERKLLKSPILGRELSGEVTTIGAGVPNFTIGDRVAAYVGSLGSNGTYAEYISVPYQLLAKLPEGISFQTAAALPLAGLTALQCFNRLTVEKDAPIFIAGGAGGVGSMLIKFLLAAGYINLFTTAGSTQSIESLLAIGLTKERIYNYHLPGLETTLRSGNANSGFDLAIDLVGGPLSTLCAGLLNVYGSYMNVTNLLTPTAEEILFNKAAAIINIANYAVALHGHSTSLSVYGQQLTTLFSKLQQGVIEGPAVYTVGEFSAKTVIQAHLMLEENQTKGNKLVMYIPS